MVTNIVKSDHSVQAPAPTVGRPSIPAPIQMLAMMHTPPIKDGCFD
uniref:Uncharacterized protein n=2 Tax=Vibrionaceae TaxID=641 RepID=A0A0H3ZQ89_VIBSP|nr:hypothetical protein [Vibrio splendidus]AKN37930.1 hypothetical protein [Enterovibrio norvegicus]